MRQTRDVFDLMLDVFPTLKARLHASARVVQEFHSESGIVKVNDIREDNLTTSEKRSLRSLRARRVFKSRS